VASSVPSSAHKCTTPWPNPSATAWTRTSARTHSVGWASDGRTIRNVLSRLLLDVRRPNAWLIPNGT